jgi:hypothetical protein
MISLIDVIREVRWGLAEKRHCDVGVLAFAREVNG